MTTMKCEILLLLIEKGIMLYFLYLKPRQRQQKFSKKEGTEKKSQGNGSYRIKQKLWTSPENEHNSENGLRYAGKIVQYDTKKITSNAGRL